jgi:hypothetical protein
MIFKPKPPPAMMMSHSSKPASVQISTFLGECLHSPAAYGDANIDLSQYPTLILAVIVHSSGFGQPVLGSVPLGGKVAQIR